MYTVVVLPMCTISASTTNSCLGRPPAGAAAAICRPHLDSKSYNSWYGYYLA
ncbi:hypothetical protein PR003_g14537 [Phytophthora rubi]|uniref:Uncharacterized protein n=1 Tax=Phytophthora rubi TaxID=129364 RepID=A0A6A4F2I9_9STRA|nr:hypothetical protein PR002_g14429 [Phytophthora rubi]KAE9018985.1 hypothetical protein PR001_g13990 [Phytophthora rubi]KAE9332406.1 hypothetical protein PR003_g14537 [Phytophthora rubi]